MTPLRTLIPEYAALVARGDFDLPLGLTAAMEQWRDAVLRSLEGRVRGKIVLTVA